MLGAFTGMSSVNLHSILLYLLNLSNTGEKEMG